MIFIFRFSVNILGHALVGQQHKLLNQLVSIFPYFGIKPKWLTIFIQIKLHFRRLKIDGTLRKSLGPEFMSEFVKQRERLRKRFPLR